MNLFKAILINIAALTILSPCILIISESETIIPNLIGVAYLLSLFLLSKTKLGIKMFKEFIKANNYISKKI